MLPRHSHAPRRRREGGPCVVSWCAVQPPAAACLAAWRPGSLLQRTPRRPRRGRAPCCTGLPACTSARRRNRGGTGDGEGRQPAPASERQQHHAPARLWMSPPPRTDLLASTPRPQETSQRKHSARRCVPWARGAGGIPETVWLDPRPICTSINSSHRVFSATGTGPVQPVSY